MVPERFDRVEDLFVALWRVSRKDHVSEQAMEIITKDGLERARRLVNDAINNGTISAATLSRRTGIKEQAISVFRNDKWTGAATTEVFTAETLSRFLNQFLHEREASQTELSGFVTTRFAEQVFAVAKWAVKRRKIACFVANAGLGKSMAVDALLPEFPGSVKVIVKGNKSTPRRFLQSVADAFSLAGAGRAADVQDRISLFLKAAIRPLFIDEAHKLTVSSLDCMREIWDEAHCPIILAATPSLYQTISTRRVGTVSSELMDQLYRRVAMFRDLTAIENPNTGEPERIVNVADIRKVFARSKIRLSNDAYEFLCMLANYPGSGGYGVCVDIVQLCVDLWSEAAEITAAHCRKALQSRIGLREAGFIIEQAEINWKRPAAAAG
jgi:DNA transposition AAA+ family ATPase